MSVNAVKAGMKALVRVEVANRVVYTFAMLLTDFEPGQPITDIEEIDPDQLAGQRSFRVGFTTYPVTIRGHLLTEQTPGESSPAERLALQILAGDDTAALIAADLVRDTHLKGHPR